MKKYTDFLNEEIVAGSSNNTQNKKSIYLKLKNLSF